MAFGSLAMVASASDADRTRSAPARTGACAPSALLSERRTVPRE